MSEQHFEPEALHTAGELLVGNFACLNGSAAGDVPGPPGEVISAAKSAAQPDPDLSFSSPIAVIAYGSDTDDILEKRLVSLREVEPLRGRYKVVWLNIDGPCTDDVLKALGAIFGLHQLALDDVTNHRQRSKFEEYKEHIFCVARMVSIKEHVDTEQLSLFLGKDFVLTFQEKAGDDCFDNVRQRIRRSKGSKFVTGPDYLAYSLLDAIIDDYFPVLEVIQQRLTGVEDYIDDHPIAEATSDVPVQIHDLRRNILNLRQTITAMREAVTPMFRKKLDLIAEETRMHFRDAYDHAMRMIDLIDLYRETAVNVKELYNTTITNRSNDLQHRNNEVMKVLTIITTLFIPPTLIAGIYGMNFKTESSPWNMPELNWVFGYPFALGLMAIMVLGLLWYLYVRGFLSRSSDVSILPRVNKSERDRARDRDRDGQSSKLLPSPHPERPDKPK